MGGEEREDKRGQRKGAGRERGEGAKENGDRPPTIFGLKVALVWLTLSSMPC